LRALIVLNENPLGSHSDVHEAFEQLVAESVIECCDIYPFLFHQELGVSHAEISRQILQLAAHGGHELIIWSHTGQLRVDLAVLEKLRRLPAKPTMVYWEGDAYHQLFKPLPVEALRIASGCDVTFLCSGGYTADKVIRAGCPSVFYAPNSASPTRFPRVWTPTGRCNHDVVMIGNRVRGKVPFRAMPGARKRARLVRALEKRYGHRFAVYGHGWTGRCAQGPCEFDDQSRIYAQSRVAVGVDNLQAPLFFSNRLPIALACGIPVVNGYVVGHEMVFHDTLGDIFALGQGDFLRIIDNLLCRDPGEMEQTSLRNRIFFEENLTKSRVVRHIIETCIQARAATTNDAMPFVLRHNLSRTEQDLALWQRWSFRALSQ
jgi:hypothetical protein